MTRFKICSAGAAVMLLAGTASAQFSNFDSLVEDFYGDPFVEGGITFSELNNELNGAYPNSGGPGEPFGPNDFDFDVFVIENSTVLEPDFPDAFSLPNTLTFGNAYVNGDNLSFGRLVSALITTGQVESGVRFDLIYLDEDVWEGIEVTLEASLGGAVVATDSFVVTPHAPGSRHSADTRVMSISGDFDSLRFYAHFGDPSAGGLFTTVRAVMDNIQFGTICSADFNGDGQVNTLDFLAFLNAFNAGDPTSDFNGDGEINTLDFLAFLNAFNTGC